MLIRIGAISVHQTAFTLAFIYGLFGCLGGLVFIIAGLSTGHPGQGSSGSRFRWRTSC